MVSKKDALKIAGELAFFEEAIELHSGICLEYDKGRYFYTKEKNEEGAEPEIIEVPKDEYVILRFNDATYERIEKFMRKVISMRGVKDLDSIDEQDADVKKMIRERRQANGNRRLGDSQVSAIIESVKRSHRPQYTLISFQVIAWAMMYEDLFIVTSKSVESKIDIDVPDEYWESRIKETSKESADDVLEKMLEKYEAPIPFVDRTNPLEIMLAITTSLINSNELFAKALGTYVTKAYAGVSTIINAGQYDDAGFLREQLVELLSKQME